MQRKLNLLTVVFALAAVLMVFKFAISLWALNRGLDLGDEPFILACLNNPREYDHQTMYFFTLFSHLFPAGFFNVAHTRLLKIIFEPLASLLLFFAFAKAMRVKVTLPVVAFYSAFWFNDIFTRSFAYNDASLLLTAIVVGGLILASESERVKQHFVLLPLILVIIGAALAAQLATKFTVFLLLMPVLVVLLTVYKNFNLLNLCSIALGFGVPYAYWSYLGHNQFDFWVHAIFTGGMVGYGEPLFEGIIRDFVFSEVPAIVPFLLVLLFWWRGVSGKKMTLVVVVSVVVHVLLTTWAIKWAGDFVFFRFSMAILVYVALLLLLFNAKSLRQKLIVDSNMVQKAVVVIYFLLPGILYAGSLTSFYESLPHFIQPWGCIWVVLLFADNYITQHKNLFSVLSLGILAIHFFYYFCWEPWGLNRPIWEHTYAVENRRHETLYFDKKTAAFYEQVGSTFQKHLPLPNDTVVALDNIGGLDYWLNLKLPESAWYLRPEEGIEHDMYYLNRMVNQHRPMPGMFFCLGVPNGDFGYFLDTCGIHFSDRYVLTDSVEFAYKECKAYVDFPKDTTMYVYFFKQKGAP